MNHPGPKAAPMGERIQPRPHRRKRRKFDHGEPIWRIDTRPMVFVFGFIALIILLPAAAIRPHATVISLWDGSGEAWWTPDSAPTEIADHHVITNRLTVSETDYLEWNGEAISFATLAALLYEVQSIEPSPVLEFEPGPNASYDLSARVIAVLRETGIDFRIVGLEKHCAFGSASKPIADGRSGTSNIAYSIYIPPESEFSKVFKGENPSALERGCDEITVFHRSELVAGF